MLREGVDFLCKKLSVYAKEILGDKMCIETFVASYPLQLIILKAGTGATTFTAECIEDDGEITERLTRIKECGFRPSVIIFDDINGDGNYELNERGVCL